MENIEAKKMKEADEILMEQTRNVEQALKPITNKRTQQSAIRKEIEHYMLPKSKIVVAFSATLLLASAEAVFGLLVV